jgi:NADH:ubiquinone reductase (H+-translocating)
VRGRRDVTVLLGDVVAIDLGSRTVESVHQLGRSVVEYDHLIVAAGAQVSYFGHREFEPYAPGLKSIEDALLLRGRIFAAFELAEATDDAELRRRLLTFVVVGAGPTGVEVAGQIAELSRRTLSRDFRRVDPTSTRVVLVDMAATVMPGSSSAFSHWAGVELAALGVELRLGRTVVAVDEQSVLLREADGHEERLDSYCKVWAAGVAASPLGAQLAEQSGASTDKSGRLQVLPDLTLPGHPEVHVVGDLMALDGVPGVAAAAMQSGTYAAREIRRVERRHGDARPFQYHDRGTLAIVARYRAIATIGGRTLHGFTAWGLWLVVHLFYIVGFKNRVTTVVHWLVSFIGRGASERTVARSWPREEHVDTPPVETGSAGMPASDERDAG